MPDPRLERVDATRLRLRADLADPSLPVHLFASEAVAIEPAAVTELLAVLGSARALAHLPAAALEAVAITPDFHKGAGIPIGTVLATRGAVFPQAIGNDLNCGMRLHSTNLPAAELIPHLDRWETAARRLFFEGGRRIPSTRRHREALLTGGLPALAAEPPPAEWETIHRHGWLTPAALDRIDQRGALPAAGAPDFADWIGAPHQLTHDDQTGSIGGGNHFVELQRVERILDRRTAWAWGLRPGDVAVMVHTGSVGIGHIAGRAIRELLRAAWPAGTPHPENGIYPLPAEGARAADRFWQLLANAANFAYANRLFLAAMAVRATEETVGRHTPARHAGVGSSASIESGAARHAYAPWAAATGDARTCSW